MKRATLSRCVRNVTIIDAVAKFNILDEAFLISHISHTLGKIMNPIIVVPVLGKADWDS